MHIPDGFLDAKTVIATTAFSAVGVSRAFRNLTRELSSRSVPLIGLAAAFIFVAQMLNFPVLGGTSGHLLGAVLVSVLLGPSAGIVVMTVVLVVQCFLFADGGVLALGANVFNMGIVASVSGYYLYRGVSSVMPSGYGRLVAIAFSSWVSVVLASVCCTGELAWSGTVAWSAGFPAMTGIHMLIGVGEALITMLVFAAVYRTRSEMLDLGRPLREKVLASRPVTDMLIYGVLITAGLALFVSPFASSWPDGLERVASALGFDAKAAANPLIHSPMADYRVPGIGSLSKATAIAGVAGAVVVFVLSFVLARTLLPRSNDPS